MTERVEAATNILKNIRDSKTHTGVISCPTDYSFYIVPYEQAIDQAIELLDNSASLETLVDDGSIIFAARCVLQCSECWMGSFDHDKGMLDALKMLRMRLEDGKAKRTAINVMR